VIALTPAGAVSRMPCTVETLWNSSRPSGHWYMSPDVGGMYHENRMVGRRRLDGVVDLRRRLRVPTACPPRFGVYAVPVPVAA
jgi:hypothetical protein